jgi:lipopolysaccharide assembly outer membrane protein LptD (OstA)
MFKVSGTVYENGKPAGQFSADRAEADKAADRLILDGGISVKAEKASMTGKKVEWLADYKVFKASGDVTLDGEDGVIGPIDVLYVDAKLKKVATSLNFFQKIKK